MPPAHGKYPSTGEENVVSGEKHGGLLGFYLGLVNKHGDFKWDLVNKHDDFHWDFLGISNQQR